MSPVRSKTARSNNAGGARLLENELEHPFAEGSGRYVARGIYTSGHRKHQPCVIKWLKSGHVASNDFFDYDIKASHKALDIIALFNVASVVDKNIRLNIPEVWEFGDEAGYYAGKKILIEHFIEGFRKWNSNTGWNNSSAAWGRVMQALSHFSYYITDGELLLCDLQGGFYSHCAVLTDPVFCSRSRSYGPTDMGKHGISNFFAHHRCNEFCHSYWTKPKSPKVHFRPVQSTTMRNAWM